MLNERNQLAKLNAMLLSLSSQLNSNDATATQDKAQLAGITRATYETSGGNQVLAAVLSAQSFNQAIDELKAANQVSQQVLDLVRTSRRLQPRDPRRAGVDPRGRHDSAGTRRPARGTE